VQQAEAYLLERVSDLQRRGIDVVAHVRRGDPARVIAAQARRWHADLVVLASHGRLGLEAFWEGSVAQTVCRRSHLPVLLVPVARS
jgi:nucleotide-binding universal stress UspA family protein